MQKTTQLFAVAILVLLATVTLSAHAEDGSSGPYSVKDGVALVIAKGVLPAQGNAPVSAQGSGFFISKLGYLVTAYHLRKDLGQVDPDSVSYEVHKTPQSQDVMPASEIYSSPVNDILVLYVSVDQDPTTLRRAYNPESKIILGRTPVYTAGYPAGYNFSVDSGIVKSIRGTASPPLPFWTTSMTFKAGQSGSPIMLDDNSVIAIVKGVDDQATSIGLLIPAALIPTNYWDESNSLPPSSPSAPGINAISEPVRITVQAQVKQTAPIPMIRTFVLRNEHCAPPSDQAFDVAASANNSIDPTSIRVTLLSVQGEVSYSIKGADSSSLSIGAHLANVGSCSIVSGVVQPSDTPAALVARVAYNEIPGVGSSQLVTVANVSGAQNVSVPLPAAAQGKLIFTAQDAAGKVDTFVPTSKELITQGGKQVLDVGKVVTRLGLLPGF